MALPVFPTKGNLLATQKSLSLARLGYDLLDKKRNILIRELLSLIDTAKSIRGQIEDVYKQAYLALQKANITLGICDEISKAVPIETGIVVKSKSVMGTSVPQVSIEETEPTLFYGLGKSNSLLDQAYILFDKAKRLTVVLAEVDNSVYRLADAIKKTNRRANALKNVLIPNFENTVKMISNSLAEKDMEEFSRLKIIKAKKESI